MWLAGWSSGVIRSLWMDRVIWLGCCLMSCVGYVWQLLQRQQQPMATMLAQQQYALAQQQQQMGRDQCLDSSFILYCSPPHFCRNLFESHSAHYLFKCFPVQMLRCRKEICIVYFVCLCLKLWPKMSTQLNLYLWVCVVLGFHMQANHPKSVFLKGRN